MAETVRTIDFGNFSWVFTFRDRITVEHVVEHQMRQTAFHLKTASRDESDPIPKEIKDALIKDNVVI